MDLAIKDVQRNLGKFVATIVGVALLLAIVLIMNGIYRGNIADGVWMINHTKAELWVVERDRGGPFNEQSTLPQSLYHSVTSVPGVQSASPFIAYAVQRQVAGKSQQFTIVGYDVFGGAGGPQLIVAGRGIRQAHYEAVADQKLGLRLGERVHLGVEDYTVVGLTKGTVDSGGNPLLYLSLPDAQQVLYQEDPQAIIRDRAADLQTLEANGNTPAQAERLLPLVSSPTQNVNAILVTLAPGANRQAVTQDIQRWLYLNVYTEGQERNLMLQGRLSRMTAILGLFRSLLVIVSIVLIALIVYVLTMEKIKSIATLKLLGAPNGVIVRLIMEQSLVLAVVGFAIGYALVIATQSRFPRTLVLLPSDTLVTFFVIFAGGVVASLFGIWRALRTPPSLALEG
ncbi:MAG TPA: ABC transporter permease [Candidatus Dormibacteraeota bacterium]|nr:ABC transporter permease [Candidatus Dormibacteraeota bacterium]